MPTLDSIKLNGLIYDLAGGGGEPVDELLGTLPFEITETGCYLLSNVDATISTGESMTDYMDYTRNDYTKTAFIGSASNSATTTIVSPTKLKLTMTEAGSTKNGSCIAQGYKIPQGNYTAFARVTDFTENMNLEDITFRINTSQVMTSTQAVGTWVHFNFAVASSTDSNTITVSLGNQSAWLSAVGNFVDVEIHIFEGTLDEYPTGADFEITANQKTNIDGYVGRALSTSTPSATVRVYKTSGATGSSSVAFFGDSIFAMGQIPQKFSQLSGVSSINLAVGGTRMSGSRDPSNEYYPYDMTQVATAISTGDFSAQINGGKNSNYSSFASGNIGNYGTFVIGFGTNDYSSMTPFNGNTTASIEGSVKYIIETILSKYKGIRLIFVSTQPYITVGYADESGVPVHPDGSVWEMNELIKGICESYNVAWIDLFHPFGMNRITRNTLTSDGVHLSHPIGVSRYSALLTGKLESHGVQYY